MALTGGASDVYVDGMAKGLATDKARLMDAAIRRELGEPLADAVDRLRGQGWTWRRIARQLTKLTGMSVTHETVRAWFGDDDKEPVA